jgi:hypothetical protein
MWTRKGGRINSGSGESIRNSIVTLDASRKLQALEFSFVHEQPGSANRLAHGYALAHDDVVVLVQHMSMRPITSEFVRGLAVSLSSPQRSDGAK